MSKFTKRELRVWSLPEQLIAFGVALVVLAVLGPFGTYDMPIGWRVAYWCASLCVGWIFVTAAFFAVFRLPVLTQVNGWVRMVAALLLGALPTVASIPIVEKLFRPDSGDALTLGLLFNVLVICLLIGGSLFVRWKMRLGAKAAASLAERSPFLDRLPCALGRDLVSLSMQDHYVSVTTTQGTDLILLRFSDAIKELNGYPGIRVHRSHWVATSAFEGFRRIKGKDVVALTDGRELPVSQTYLEKVKGALGVN
ncbi:MAG: LytTR family transcriptional regulator [Rhodobacteraceae bacterium]|nr:LytTR family transcriptional regulator [Paracoccaceae bacterium]